MRVLTCDPAIEVSGQTVLSFIENAQSDEIVPFVKQYGLTNIDPNQWYSFPDFQALLNKLGQLTNASLNFVAIGMAISKLAPMPPGMENSSVEKVIETWDEHYHLSHRNGNIGHKIVQKIDTNHYKVILDGSLYPDDFEYGVLYGFAKRYLPPHISVTIWYDKDIRRLDHGGSQTVMYISWK